MRIRSTKPEFWRSKRIASVDWGARLVLKGLESYVDDNGVGKDDLALIVADIFPRDLSANPRDTLARVSEAVSNLHRAGLVWRYEANGTRLLYVSFWESIQRIDKPGKGRLPRPDGTFDYKDSEIRESVASPPETVAPGTGEQGNRGTGEQGSSLALRKEAHQEISRDSRNAALRIINAWHDAQTQTPPAVIVNDVSEQVQRLVNEGIDHDRITAGLASWWAGDSYSAKNIPAHVARAGRQHQPRKATGTTRAEDIMAIDTSSIGGIQ